MNRLTLWIRILLGVGFVLSGAALARESMVGACGACTVGGPDYLPIVGLVFYGLLFAASILPGAGALVGFAIALAVAAHGLLTGYMVFEGKTCLLCLGAALNALVLFGLSLARDPDNLVRSVIVIPLGAVVIPAALLLMEAPPATSNWREPEVISSPDLAESANASQVRILVFEQKDCPYCEELRDRLTPAINREFGPRVTWSFRKATEMPGIRNTPTVVVLPTHGKGSTVFEGLPPYEALAAAVREHLPTGEERTR
jgi:hypothetical protein